MQYTTLVFILPYRYVLGGFSLVDCNPCLLMCRCTIFVFLDLSKVFIDQFFCETPPGPQETLFDFLEDTLCSWAEKCCM